jgi:hypothetical protein
MSCTSPSMRWTPILEILFLKWHNNNHGSNHPSPELTKSKQYYSHDFLHSVFMLDTCT